MHTLRAMFGKHAMASRLLILPMLLDGGRIRAARIMSLDLDVASQPETQTVDVYWDGYCGSMQLNNMMGNLSDAGKLCACKEDKVRVMKARNGYKANTLPTIQRSTFLEKLTHQDNKWVLQGALNGWAALVNLRLKSIKCLIEHGIVEIWRETNSGVEVPWDTCDEIPRATLFSRTEKIHAHIIPDDYCDTHEDPLICTNADCYMKSMRPTPSVELSTLEKELKQREEGGLVYEGAPNGWQAFANLPASVTCSDGTEVAFRGSLWAKPTDCRPKHVNLVLPAWMSRGWSPESPGFVFRFQPKVLSSTGNAHIAFGTDLLREASSTRLVKKVYAFAHRYAPAAWTWKLHEKVRDVLTFHAALLIEWEDTPYTTLIELAWQNGLGGYKGKSNWYHDKDSKETELFRTMLEQAGTIVQPWHTNRHEIRILDMPIASHGEFIKYVEQYSEGKQIRFFQVHGLKSKKMASPALPGRNTEAAIFNALLNYNRNSGGGYAESGMNCQTFQADFFSWLTGKDTHVFVDKLKTPSSLIMKYVKHLDWFESRDT